MPKKAGMVPDDIPGLCQAADLASLFGLTNQRISQLAKDGVLKRVDTPEGKRFRTAESTRSMVEHLRNRAKEPNDQERDKQDAENRYKIARARKMEMESDELEGKMHRSEDVEAMVTDLVFAVRSSLTAMPGRLAMDIVGVKTPAEAADMIRKEVNLVLREMTEYQYDPVKYQERVRERKKWETEHLRDKEENEQ